MCDRKLLVYTPCLAVDTREPVLENVLLVVTTVDTKELLVLGTGQLKLDMKYELVIFGSGDSMLDC